MRERDILHRFVFENTHVRGQIVHLDATWQAVLERHDYPPAVRPLLGQAMAATALLSATIKFNGALIFQVQSAGPVRLLLAQATSQRPLRGLARWDGEVQPAPFPQLVGDGRLAITIDTAFGAERYQGIVELGADNLAAAVEEYFARSEQLATRLWLAADGARAAGMLLQRLPGEDADQDAWDRAVHLGATLTDDELLRFPVQEVLHRLYHGEDIRLFEAEPVSFRCSCSRGRIANMLRALGYESVQALIREQGSVRVDCEFCNQR